MLEQAGGLLAGQVAQRVDAHPYSGFRVSGHQAGQVGVGVAQVRRVHVAGADDELAAQPLAQRARAAQPQRLLHGAAQQAQGGPGREPDRAPVAAVGEQLDLRPGVTVGPAGGGVRAGRRAVHVGRGPGGQR